MPPVNLIPGARAIPDPEAEVRRLAGERGELANASLPRRDLDISPDPKVASLEERVAALEAILAVQLGLSSPPHWTEAAVAEVRERLAEAAAKPPPVIPPPLSPDEIRQLLSECVTVVKAGETLILRCPEGWTPDQAGEMQRHAARWLAENAPDVKAMIVPHLDIIVAEPAEEASGAT